jgi:hypothetical protein
MERDDPRCQLRMRRGYQMKISVDLNKLGI